MKLVLIVRIYDRARHGQMLEVAARSGERSLAEIAISRIKKINDQRLMSRISVLGRTKSPSKCKVTSAA